MSLMVNTIKLQPQYHPNKQLVAYNGVDNEAINQIAAQIEKFNLNIFLDKDGRTLDWFAEYVHGFKRPVIPLGALTSNRGAYGQFRYLRRYLYFVRGVTPPARALTDDEFKRMLIWHFDRSDVELAQTWALTSARLKYKINRFLADDIMDNSPTSYGLDVTHSGLNVTIKLSKTNTLSLVFKYLCEGGFLALPRDFNFKVTLV